MPEQPSKGPQLAVNKLLGINLRKSPSQLDEGECDRNFGLYPERTGALTRMPGKTLWRVFEDGTTGRAVLNAKQAFGTGIIIQNGDQISVYSLDELRNRVMEYTLTPDTTEAFAIIGNYQNAGVFGGALGSNNNTFYSSTLSLISDEEGFIVSLSANTFRIPIGVYRISGFVTFGTTSSGGYTGRAGLYNLTNLQFQPYYEGSSEILSTSQRASSNNSGTQATTGRIMGRFAVTQAAETFAIYMATSGGASSTSAQGRPASGVTTQKEVYSLLKITRE